MDQHGRKSLQDQREEEKSPAYHQVPLVCFFKDMHQAQAIKATT